MTVTVDLPQHIELAYIAAAEAKGVPVDVLVRDVLLSHLCDAQAVPETISPAHQWVEEDGVSVLRTGQRISSASVDQTLDQIRRERDLTILGQY